MERDWIVAALVTGTREQFEAALVEATAAERRQALGRIRGTRRLLDERQRLLRGRFGHVAGQFPGLFR